MTRLAIWFFSAVTVFTMGAMVVLLVMQSLPVWQHQGFSFVTGTKWYYRQQEFGAAPMIYGTLVVSLGALMLATPLGIGAAIFTAEYLPARFRLMVKLVIELLAGVPSVIYGLLGILILRNWIYDLLSPFDPLSGDTLITAIVLLAVMILPTVMTLSDDAFRSVPAGQRHAARGLGLNGTEVVLYVSLPQAAHGLFAAVLLGLGRAMGETIAVFLVLGRQDNQWPKSFFSWQPLMESGQTLTSKLGSSETNIAYGSPLHWGAMVGLGLILLVIVMLITWFSARLQRSDHVS